MGELRASLAAVQTQLDERLSTLETAVEEVKEILVRFGPPGTVLERARPVAMHACDTGDRSRSQCNVPQALAGNSSQALAGHSSLRDTAQASPAYAVADGDLVSSHSMPQAVRVESDGFAPRTQAVHGGETPYLPVVQRDRPMSYAAAVRCRASGSGTPVRTPMRASHACTAAQQHVEPAPSVVPSPSVEMPCEVMPHSGQDVHLQHAVASPEVNGMGPRSRAPCASPSERLARSGSLPMPPRCDAPVAAPPLVPTGNLSFFQKVLSTVEPFYGNKDKRAVLLDSQMFIPFQEWFEQMQWKLASVGADTRTQVCLTTQRLAGAALATFMQRQRIEQWDVS